MNIFDKTGCIEDSEYEGLYSHDKLPFEMMDRDGFLKITIALEYVVSENKIPTTESNIKNLITVFNPNK